MITIEYAKLAIDNEFHPAIKFTGTYILNKDMDSEQSKLQLAKEFVEALVTKIQED